MDSCMEDAFSNFEKKDGIITGYIDSEKCFADFMLELKLRGFEYSIRSSSTVDSGHIQFQFNAQKHERTPNIRFFGSPFSLIKRVHYECAQGPKYYNKEKKANLSDHPNTVKKRFYISDTKKLGCPAWISAKSVRIYPDFKIEKLTWRAKKKKTDELKAALESASPPNSFLRYYIKASSEGSHSHSKCTTQLSQKIDSGLIDEINRLVQCGISSVRDIKILLGQFVERTLLEDVTTKPDHITRAFYPSDAVIRTHICRAIYNNKKSKFDQEALSFFVEKWRKEFPNDKVFYRPYENNDDSNQTLLFCYQSEWQRKLLLRYGKICLLDATYKTTKYALPLFFLVVKTNVNYIVVGIFVIQAECSNLIAESLQIFKEWSPHWKPRFWMTDFSDVEIRAIEVTFPGNTVYLCAFHREQAWLRWVRKSGNVLQGDAEEILNLWHNVAQSSNMEEYNNSVAAVNNSEVMVRNPKARQYFLSQWLSEAHRWVYAFSEKDVITVINTNNGVESQNKVLKHSYLCRMSDKSLSGMLKIVIEKFLPDSFHKYCYKNSYVKSINSEIPSFLHDRPLKFVQHVLSRMYSAQANYNENSITIIEDGQYKVKSESDPTKYYNVNFSEPSCSCYDFQKYRLPCKHMCAVFEYCPFSGFDKLNADYRNSPYITIDTVHSYKISNNNPLMIVCNEDNTLLNEIEDPTEDIIPDEDTLREMKRKLREEAKRLIDLSYLCNKKENLREAVSCLRQQCIKIEQHMENLTGLPLTEQPQTANKRKIYQKLPSKQLKRAKYSNRVGKTAEMWKNATAIQLSL